MPKQRNLQKHTIDQYTTDANNKNKQLALEFGFSEVPGQLAGQP